jgi:hypothetical protein
VYLAECKAGAAVLECKLALLDETCMTVNIVHNNKRDLHCYTRTAVHVSTWSGAHRRVLSIPTWLNSSAEMPSMDMIWSPTLRSATDSK